MFFISAIYQRRGTEPCERDDFVTAAHLKLVPLEVVRSEPVLKSSRRHGDKEVCLVTAIKVNEHVLFCQVYVVTTAPGTAFCL